MRHSPLCMVLDRTKKEIKGAPPAVCATSEATTSEMREIIIDGERLVKPDDLYDAFFLGVGAPSWHGRNFNALRESIGEGRINEVEVPYLIRIKNYALIGRVAKELAKDFISLIKELHESGVPVDIEVD